MKIIRVTYFLILAAIISGCSESSQAPVATVSPPVVPQENPPQGQSTTIVQEPKVEFALDCVSDSTPKRRAIFVSLGSNAMFTNFYYRIQYSLNLIDTTPENYIYRVNLELTGSGASRLEDTTITVNRETLKLLYTYKESFGSGVDPFSCIKSDDPNKAHEVSKELLISEAQKSASAAEKARIDAEKANDAQLKRNKI